MPHPLDCPLKDWWQPTPPGDLVSGQVAGLLGHIEEAHGEPLPEPIREAIKACKKELETLPV
ncbi:MAG: hypothetical protein ACRDKB_05525 [Actinomycetota bacterium]